MKAKTKFKGTWIFECFDKLGNFKWKITQENLVTNVGLQHILDTVFSGGGQEGTWYIGLTDGTPTVNAADTMSSHGGWTEVEDYDEGVRQTWTEVRSGQSMTNAAAKAIFTIDANATTIGGGFLTSDNTKGGSSGTLMAVVAFTLGDKTLDDDDVLNVTYTLSAADA